jgi:hypothetical protein
MANTGPGKERLMQDPEVSRSIAMPWDFKPLRGILLLFGSVALLFTTSLAFIVTVGGLVFLAVRFEGSGTQANTSTKIVAYLGVFVVAFMLIWASVALNRRVNLSEYLKKCPPGSIYLLRGSLLRSFRGVGSVSFGENAMLLKGQLGPNLLWPLLVIVAIDIASVLMILSGGGGVVVGGLGAIVVLVIYNFLFRDDGSVSLGPACVARVSCSGPTMKIRFKPKPIASLRGITMLIPSDQRAGFFRAFDNMFPGTLPPAWREALKKCAEGRPPFLS